MRFESARGQVIKRPAGQSNPRGWRRQYGFCPEGTTGLRPGFYPRVRIKNDPRPEGGGREAFSALDAERDPQRISAAPFLLRPLFPELRRTSGAGPLVNVSWGLNPRLSPIVPSGQRILYDLNICPHFRSHITPSFEYEDELNQFLVVHASGRVQAMNNVTY